MKFFEGDADSVYNVPHLLKQLQLHPCTNMLLALRKSKRKLISFDWLCLFDQVCYCANLQEDIFYLERCLLCTGIEEV